MTPKRRLRVKGPRTKVRTRHMYDGVQGSTVRVLSAGTLPTGCCVLRDGVPCIYRMTHIDMKVERMWLPSEQAEVPVVKVLGYCKSHRPKHREVITLGADLEKQLNGPKSQKARMRRKEQALYVNMVPQGGVVKHSVSRTQLRQGVDGGWVLHPIDTACGKRMKQGYIPSMKEANEDYPKECPKCNKAITVVPE